MTYVELRSRAVELRKVGYSYNLISEELSVSKGTLHSWLAEIPYRPNRKVEERIGAARAKSGETKHRKKLATFKEAEKLAESDIGTLTKRDIFMLGIGIYIGEGEKGENIGVINADPRIIRLAMRWLQEARGLDIENFTLAIHLYPDNNSGACLKYWSKETGIPLSQFGKTQIDRRTSKQSGKRGKLPYGTAHLRVRSNGNKEFGVLLSRRIRAWMDRVLKDTTAGIV